ncbi:hypothetical protein N7474_000671 [Penicillium riverlandense]|uniref:uncharacterized protein n=1 Tax=Penicillium riverlandense TaxID=1903569 RepID=UPI002547FD99|nr:uncharacterized protein N7474_000671 [Penicillium riverlandense]KAJ5832360.1 hypothetical protein N7474_000671 [Penicillium riverlandense]
MQSLWSRAAPSQSTCRCVSCLNTAAKGVTSRSATAASRRKLRIGNSVTLFYTSIFAGAALADARGKDKRRNDWDEKIAAVKAEVNELVDEEQRILDALSYHTQRRLMDAASAQISESAPVDHEQGVEHQEPEEGELYEEEDEGIPDWAFHDPLRLKAIQKLALTQFAIRLLLRPTIAHRYSGISMNYASDPNIPSVNVEKLLRELNNIRRRIHELKTQKSAEFGDVISDYTILSQAQMQERRDSLEAELKEDVDLFMSRQMSLEELLLRLSNNLLNSPDPDRTPSFRIMMIAFTRARQNDLGDLLLRTLLPHYFQLTQSVIVTIISFFRKSKNLKGFDQFLEMLSGHGGYPANLGKAIYRRRKLNGIDLVVPTLDSSNPVIYTALISAALRFDQPDRADAWLQAARSVGFFDDWNTLFSYLRFYSIRQDWDKGTHVLKRAVTFLVSSTDHSPDQVERLLVRMVHLCDSCGQKDTAEALIAAAMHSGFNPAMPSGQRDVVPIVDSNFSRWRKAADGVPNENIDRPLWQQCQEFANIVQRRLDHLEVLEKTSTSRHYTELAGPHAQSAPSVTRGGGSMDTEAASVGGATSETHPSALNSDNTTSQEDVTALKAEMAQLRALVFELRKHHIQDSFKEDESLADEEAPSDIPQTQTQTPPPDTPARPTQPLNVEFERISTLINSDKFTTAPSALYPRGLGKLRQSRKQRADVLKRGATHISSSSFSSASATTPSDNTAPAKTTSSIPAQPDSEQAKTSWSNLSPAARRRLWREEQLRTQPVQTME